MEVIEGLNEKQAEAVLYFGSPLLVLAGAGSGKTKVITHKIIFLIKELEIPLDRILAITFTNKAASEMKERVKNYLGLEEEPQWISTFHSFCVKVLRSEAESIGYSRDFIIYDEEDSKKAIKDVVKELNLNSDLYKPERVKHIFSNIKQSLDDTVLEFYSFTMPHLPEIYKKYEEHLAFSNAMDFDDLLINVVKLFNQNPDILKRWQNRFDYILVDEYQDTNKVQHQILKLLVGDRDCITVVGDPQQCIYTWRGANPENILEFEKDFPGTKIIKLERNYRSTEKILSIANKVISGSKGRWKEKILKLWTDRKGGEDIYLIRLDTDKHESGFIGKMIKKIISDEGYSYRDFAVLIRMSYVSRNIEEAFINLKIPYQIVGGVKFFERAEVKDILAYLRFALLPKDTQAFKRIINLPSRGIGDKTIEKIRSFYERDWLQALEDSYNHLSPKIRMRVQEFLEIIETVRKYGNEKPSQMAKYVFDAINYEEYLVSKYPKDYEDRIANVNELFNALKEVERSGKSLLEFLEESSLSQAQDSIQEENSVKIMTVHASKGLEFPVVFIAGLEEGIFPSGRSFEDIEQMEEERRLFYVAITRAKEKLFLTYSKYRAGYGSHYNETKPSRFLQDIKDDLKIISTQRAVRKRSDKVNTTVSSDDLKVGQAVKHDIFGKGVITKIDGNKAVVIFEKVGEKTIRKDFLKI
ncbi:MAG TPA: DNA helicase UvrD [Persephonella sp.]|uniref:DNA 3'-5' helicase n=1 Tax=Persephonella marina (strain DSM 14350 / EX-H1) TaxID=123214 RepID=C0QQ32_PERMH|nr:MULTISPECIES: UvrD-helicase domain-containing protein [Persephonella]ACO03570.1 ATP-dependent DNA helicase PcrA [Persephonella marina EX-H1]HCB69607.1 DNA helicase UvrD [Persephonella sp.]